jgi:hypothetical protein
MPRVVAAEQEANQRRVAPPSPMREGVINKARMLANRNQPRPSETGCSFFPLYYQAENIYCRFGKGGDLTMARRVRSAWSIRRITFPGSCPAADLMRGLSWASK